ncbi:ADA regulatory protein / Methylated-DNA--protein-cysteine methyltransferase [hydrothermal vent metagenome]|uniref:methylated-DNA--[protein]-cysteine S-methyltransferase n=1 Tax=hydrothermal vent metagenome TaxID=652676 RepID=A0A1W1EF17_9ZZZZ
MNLDYERVKKAIEFINSNLDEKPLLKDVARHIGLSEADFQIVLSRWAGVTPKRYLQTITVKHAKKLLKEEKPLLDFSLYLDFNVKHKAVSTGEYNGLHIDYAVHDTPFGEIFIAITKYGICKLSFIEESYERELTTLAYEWENATMTYSKLLTKPAVEAIFNIDKRKEYPLSVLLSGTNFQIDVWKALLELPSASLSSYGDIAKKIGKPKAHRAVGTAIGKNPIAFLIPCHRVIQQSGKLGGYRWGETRKHAMHAWEINKKDNL